MIGHIVIVYRISTCQDWMKKLKVKKEKNIQEFFFCHSLIHLEFPQFSVLIPVMTVILLEQTPFRIDSVVHLKWGHPYCKWISTEEHLRVAQLSFTSFNVAKAIRWKTHSDTAHVSFLLTHFIRYWKVPFTTIILYHHCTVWGPLHSCIY